MNNFIKSKKLEIEYNSAFSISFSNEIEVWFQKQWDKQIAFAQQNNSLLYNGTLFHVANKEENNDIIFLKLGETNYRSYVGSRSIEFKEKYPNVSFAKPLAACIALITSDKKLLVEKRKGVDVHEGMYHVVGGFVDPSKDIDELGNPDPFLSIIRELKEETGLSIDRSTLLLAGLAEDTLTPHFELCFCSLLRMSSKEVSNIINNSINDGEFNKPIFIDFSKSNIASFLDLKKDSISPTGRSCIEMATILLL